MANPIATSNRVSPAYSMCFMFH